MRFPTPSDAPPPIIRASEISQYVFCQRAWWLGSIQGYRPLDETALKDGERAHLDHGRRVAASRRWRRFGYILLVAGGILVIVGLCSLMGGGL